MRDRYMRKTVDVFLRDRLVASYPVVLSEIDRPADDEYSAEVRRYMRRHYNNRDIAAARLVVRGLGE
jgi:hypothetical protein